MDAQGSDPVSVGAKTNPYRWVRHSIHPQGLLDEQHIDHRKYSLSEFGYREGQPFAGYQLELATRLPDERSLRSFYGMTKTRSGKETTPPMDRLEIYEKIAKQSCSSLNELDSELDIPRGTIVNNLNWMEDSGLIEFNSINFKTQDETTRYRIVNGFDLYANGGSMREAVFGTIIALQEDGKSDFSKLEFISTLDRKYPDHKITEPKSRKSALRIMRGLVEENHLSQDVEQHAERPEIILVPEMKSEVIEILQIFDGVRSGDQSFREEGYAKLQAILANKEAVRHLIDKAMKASPEVNAKSLIERTRDIEACLSNVGVATISELYGFLAAMGHTPSSIRETLANLRSQGRVVSQTAHGEHLWSLAASDA
jgi:hypothetical protein